MEPVNITVKDIATKTNMHHAANLVLIDTTRQVLRRLTEGGFWEYPNIQPADWDKVTYQASLMIRPTLGELVFVLKVEYDGYTVGIVWNADDSDVKAHYGTYTVAMIKELYETEDLPPETLRFVAERFISAWLLYRHATDKRTDDSVLERLNWFVS